MIRDDHKWLAEKPFAHRGLHGESGMVENSLAAFRAAIEAGVGIELDVRCSADQVAVVFHDRELDRLTDAKGLVDQECFASLGQIPLKGLKETIPSLDQALALIAGRVPLLIELKPQGAIGPLEQAVKKALEGYRGPMAVMSFDPRSVAWFLENVPDIPRGLVASCRFNGQYDRLFSRAALGHLIMRSRTKADFIAFDIRCLPNFFTRKMQKKSLPVLTWTVRSPADKMCAERTADNIIFEQI